MVGGIPADDADVVLMTELDGLLAERVYPRDVGRAGQPVGGCEDRGGQDERQHDPRPDIAVRVPRKNLRHRVVYRIKTARPAGTAFLAHEGCTPNIASAAW